MDADESLYHASPQVKGKIAHESIDNKKASTLSNDIISLSVYSEKYGLIGKIDIYKKKKKLIENTQRVLDNIVVIIEEKYSKKFCGSDSVIIFDVSSVKLKKYGNAIHRDVDVVFF